MKRGIFAVLCVLLTGLLISGCAVYPGKGKPCVGTASTVVNVGSGISKCCDPGALAAKAQAAQTILAAMERDGHPCYDCPPREVVTATYAVPAPRAETNTYTTARESGESWVFKWEPAGQGYIWAITNPKYLNASPGAGQEVYFVGDGQGWYSKAYPMAYPMSVQISEYRVKLPVSKFLGRNRCNYLIMDGSSGDGIWAMFGPSDDRTWVKTGDYDSITNQNKYCIIFVVNQDGTVVPSE